MKKYFSFIIRQVLIASFLIGVMITEVFAVTYPVGTPAGEEVGGWFNTYFSNIFDPIGCNPGQVIRGFTSTGMLLCITPTVVSCLPGGIGLGNSCYGSGSLQNGTTGANNTSNGNNSLFSNTTGNFNSAYGAESMYLNTNGSNNIAVGYQALYSNLSGGNNTAIGNVSLFWNTTGSNNTANGYQSLWSNITGSNNVADGYAALSANTTGSNNTADGYQSLGANTTGCGNIAVGYQALGSNTIGSISIANGYRAGFNLISGDNNIAIGANTDFPNPLGSNQLNIGNAIFGVGLNGTVGSPAGNIGIGTASPGARLEIAGSIKIVDGTQGTGKVLVSDSNGLANWSGVAPGVTATGIVGDSGSENYLSKFGTGGLGIYISQLFDDGTNVGIGTASPGAKLEVAGQVKITGGTPGVGKVLVSDAVGLATWSPPVAGLPCIPTGIGANNACYGSGSLQNNTNGSSNTAYGIASLFNNTTGNQNTANGADSLISNISGYANTANGYGSLYSNTIGLQNTANGFGALYLNTIGSSNLAEGYRAGFNLLSGNNNIALGSNTDFANSIGSDQLNIGNAIFGVGLSGTVGVPAGNIGIGTASPTARLEVAGQIKITGGTPGTGKVLSSSDATGLATWVTPAAVGGAWVIDGNAGTVAGTNFLGTTDAIDLVFKTNNTEKVRILSAGNVGIGTPSPGAKLEVAGQVKITGGTPGLGKLLVSDATGLASWTSTISGATATGIIGSSGSDNYLSKFGTGGLGIYVSQLFDNGTNVGIGTASPGSKLEVAGQVKITGGSPGLGKVLISDATGLASWSAAPTLTNMWSIIGNSGTVAGTNFLGTTDAIDLVFKTNNTETVRILTSGNMGIGTPSPGAKLEVAGQVKITGGTPGLGKILTSDATGLATWTGVVTATGINITGSVLGSTLYYNGSNWLAGTGIFNTGGNIGIGTVAPGSKLEVAGQVKITGGTPGLGKLLVSDATGLASWTSTISGATATGIIGSSGSDNYLSKFGTGGLGIYVSQLFDNGTNVGIGTASPGSKLEVAGQVKITGGSPGLGKVLISDATGLASWSAAPTLTNMWSIIGNSGTVAGTNFLGTTDAIDLVFKTNNTETVRILTSGNMGIGTPSPGAKLEVAGQVKITGGTPGLGKILTSDATGLATWTNTVSGATATGIIGSSGSANYLSKFGTGGLGIYISQLFDNGTNVGIGTASPGSKLEVAGNTYINGNLTVSGSVIVDKIVNRTVTNVSISGSLYPDTTAPLAYRDIGSTTQRWNNLYLSGQVAIAGGTPGLGKVLTSDASGLASWSAAPTLTNMWNILGNSGTVAGTNFLGTTDAIDLVFKTNNAETARILSSGNFGIGTPSPGAKLEVAGQVKITGGAPGLGKLLVSDATGLASWTNTVSGATATGIIGSSGSANYLSKFGTGGLGIYISQLFDNGTNVGIGTASPGAKLEVAGQVKITGGSPGLGKILTSDATGLATWTGVVTATGINMSGSVLGSTLYYNGTAWTAGTGIYNTGGNIGIGTSSPSSKLTIDSGITGSGGLRLSRISSTTTPYSGPNVGLGVDASGNLVPVSNGDVVVYTAKGRNGAQPTPDPDLPNRLIGYNFNTYFAIPTSQSFVVSDGNGAGYNAPYFKENGTSGICSGGGSPYDCANPDPVVGVSASPNNSFTMTAKGSVYGYQLALGARGDAPLFARSGKFVGSQTGGLFLSDNTTPTPWQKVLTVPANHLEYFYVNIGYNSQLQTISGGGNVGIGTSFPDRRLVIASSGTTFADDPIVQIRRGFQGADGALGNTYGLPYLNIGGLENRVGSIQTIAFGYSSQSGTVRIAPAEIGFLTTSVTGNTKGDIVFANRDGTTNVAPTEVMRITSSGYVGIGTGAPSQQLEISKSMDLAPTSSATNGVIYKNNTRFIHNFAKYAPNDNNVFIGLGAGNFTMGTGILADPVFYGTENVAIGASTLAANTTGYSNTAVGHTSLTANTSGYNNMAVGWGALATNTTGYANTGIGRQTLGSNTTGYYNTAIGMSALQANIDGYYNSALGHSALAANTTGFQNTAQGYQALLINTSGQYNTANGAQSLYKNIVGLSNTAVGYQSLYNTTVSNNTGLGVLAGSNITTGGSNIAIGYNSQVGSPTGSNQLSIGNWIYGSGGYIGVGISNPTAKLDVAGNFKLGTAGTVTTAAGVCTISATAITTTAATYTCTGVPASTAVAVHCNAGAAFTTPNTTSLYCRANGTLNQVICNTTVANSVSTTYKCMWMQ